ncbi:hypothetical protein JMJ77_0004876, partial [Colletotrichum scovillei]
MKGTAFKLHLNTDAQPAKRDERVARRRSSR